MAVLLQLTVTSATRARFQEVDDEVGQAMMRAGGPPPELMSHVVYPDGDGFVVADVWRTEAAGRGYVEEVLRPLLSGLGLDAGATLVLQVWWFARP